MQTGTTTTHLVHTTTTYTCTECGGPTTPAYATCDACEAAYVAAHTPTR